MFGIFRVFLAIAVVMNHTDSFAPGRRRDRGILLLYPQRLPDDVADDRRICRQALRFFLNRFLRPYPMYWGALIITLLVWTFIETPAQYPRSTSVVLQVARQAWRRPHHQSCLGRHQRDLLLFADRPWSHQNKEVRLLGAGHIDCDDGLDLSFLVAHIDRHVFSGRRRFLALRDRCSHGT